MPARKAWIAGLVAVSLWPGNLRAQIPGLPPAAGAFSPATGASALGGLGGAGSAGSALGGLGGAGAAAQPTTIWSSLGLTSSNLQACQAKICASPFGQMLNSLGTGPVASMTGGFLPSLCPPSPNASQIAAMQGQPGGASAAAAKIQASEANAEGAGGGRRIPGHRRLQSMARSQEGPDLLVAGRPERMCAVRRSPRSTVAVAATRK